MSDVRVAGPETSEASRPERQGEQAECRQKRDGDEDQTAVEQYIDATKEPDFEHDDNSPEDPSGGIDASRIKTLALGDITALAGGGAANNRIWIGRIEMLK